MKTLSNFLSNSSHQEEDRGCRKNPEGGTHEEEGRIRKVDGHWCPQEGAGTVRVLPGEGERRGFLVVHLGLWEPTTSTFRASLAWAAVITKPQTALIEIRGGRKLAEKPA
jgi:hypothetical protein